MDFRMHGTQPIIYPSGRLPLYMDTFPFFSPVLFPPSFLFKSKNGLAFEEEDLTQSLSGSSHDSCDTRILEKKEESGNPVASSLFFSFLLSVLPPPSGRKVENLE